MPGYGATQRRTVSIGGTAARNAATCSRTTAFTSGTPSPSASPSTGPSTGATRTGTRVAAESRSKTGTHPPAPERAEEHSRWLNHTSPRFTKSSRSSPLASVK